MKTLGALDTNLSTGTTTLSWCWRITRAGDGNALFDAGMMFKLKGGPHAG
jgi:hypothetical protein